MGDGLMARQRPRVACCMASISAASFVLCLILFFFSRISLDNHISDLERERETKRHSTLRFASQAVLFTLLPVPHEP